MSERLTVKEFAAQAGVSPQAIYQRLQRDLAPYLQVANGKKTIDSAALQLFSDKPFNQLDCASTNKSLQDEITVELIKTLREQLAEKDKQLEAAAAEKAALLDRLRDAQQSEQQAHALHAGTMQAAALIETREANTNYTGEKEKRGWKFWRRR